MMQPVAASESPPRSVLGAPPQYDEIDVIHAYAEEPRRPPSGYDVDEQQHIPSSLIAALERRPNTPPSPIKPLDADEPYNVSYLSPSAFAPLHEEVFPGSSSVVHIPLTQYNGLDLGQAAPGVYTDAAPDMSLLNGEQRKIAKEYPRDLDDEPRTLVQSLHHGFVHWRDYCKWRYTHYYIIIIAIIALIVLMTVFHEQIIDWLEPISRKVRTVGWGWIIPVAILFVLSFPPLFGGEIIAALCGIVYGVWIGFGIVALGTLLGEIGNYYLFKYTLQKLARRTERRSMLYASLAKIIRTGGFKVRCN